MLFEANQNPGLSFSIGCVRGVKLIPSFYPCDHGICKLVKVRINLGKLLFHLLWQFNIALLDSGAIFWKHSRLEKWDDLFLPEDAFVFFLQIHKWVASFAVKDVGQTCLHPQPQVITYHLKKITKLSVIYSFLWWDAADRKWQDWEKRKTVGYLGAPTSPHIVIAANWLTITHQSKVHCRPNQLTVECQVHATHREQGSLWNRQDSIHIPDNMKYKLVKIKLGRHWWLFVQVHEE